MSAEPDAMRALHRTSDGFLAQVEVLLALEEKKRSLSVDDPGFPALAEQVEDLVRQMLARAEAQTASSASIHEGSQGADTSVTLADVGENHTPVMILGMWRDVERELETIDPGSTEHAILRARGDALRTAYQRAYHRERGR